MKLPYLNLLAAYPYMSDGMIKAIAIAKKEVKMRFILDSGAFTAWNSGKVINMDEYCKFIDSLPFKPDFIVQLDVFGDSEKTYENYQLMKKRGYKVMPVFTRGDTKERLEEFYKDTDYIMFGGIVIGGKNTNYVKWFLEQNKGRKCHWLGFVKMPFIKHFKPESVDSSSVTSSERYGILSAYRGFGNVKSFRRTDFAEGNPFTDSEMKIARFLPSEVSELKKEDAWKAEGKAEQMNMRTHVLRSVEVEKILGTKIYLAITKASKVRFAVEQFNRIIK